MQSQPGWPNVAVKLGTTGASGAFSIFDSSDRKLLSLDGDALLWLGIGGSSSGVSCCPGRMLIATMRADPLPVGGSWSAWRGLAITDLWDGTMVLRILARGPGETGGVAQIATDYSGRSLSFATGLFVEAMRISADQNVGIGTSAPRAKLHVQSLSEFTWPGTPRNVRIESSHPYNTTNNGAGVSFGAFYTETAKATIAVISGIKESSDLGNYAGALTFGTRVSGSGAEPMERMRIKSTGEVVIGQPGDTARRLTVNGEIAATRVIGAIYQDLAEWVPATTDMAPGTVVVLNRERSNEVMPSFAPYDSTVAGVVSAQPGILLGEDGPSKEQIATTGRVRVRVDATVSPIRIGDLLVTGNRPGTAMKSTPLDLHGVAIHRPGTVLGKALESLESGEGEILVLLSLQ